MPRHRPSRPPPQRICVEGNKGGTFIGITETETEGVIHLSVGHDCVNRIDQEISVYALAAILDHAAATGFEHVLAKIYPQGIPELAKPFGPALSAPSSRAPARSR